MRTAPLLLALITCLASPTAAAESALVEKTLKPKARLALPWLRVPVGPGRPLALSGRSAKVGFVEEDGVLRVDATSADGFETIVRAGESVAVELDRASPDEPPPVRNLVFTRGDPEAGEPRWSVVSLDVLEGSIGGERVIFVDHSADGRFLGPHSDFLVRRKGGEVFPVCAKVVLGRRVFRVGYDEAARTVASEPDKEFVDPDVFPSWAGVAEGLAHLNEIRRGMNMLPVALSRKASRHTMLHVRYLARNGGNGHMEERGKPGYTREGLRAGVSAIGSMNKGGVPSSIDGHLSSLLHRMDLIDPTITEVGIAVDSSRVWIHTECGKRRQWDGQGPVIFPGPNGAWSPGTYSGENPDPRPEGESKTSGLPVTVSWFGRESIKKIRVELRGARGRIRCWRNDSDGRDLKTNHPSIRAALMPHSSLKGRNLLLLTWVQDGKPCRMDYEFEIGRWK
jgi:hypothetical protein